MDTEQLALRVDSALRQIGFVQSESNGRYEDGEHPSGTSEQQSVDEDELLRIVQQERTNLKLELSNNAQTAQIMETEDIAQWKHLLAQIPYCIVLDILEYCELEFVHDNHKEFIGYFGRDQTRKCYLIFRSLNMSNVPSPNMQEEGVNVEPYSMTFIMQHVLHLTVHSVENLLILDQWMRHPWMKTCLESIIITDIYSRIGHEELHSLCPAIFSVCKSLHTEAISDKVLKFKNLAQLVLHSDFPSADIRKIEQLPAHSLTSLTMVMSTQEHIRLLSGALGHFRNLKELHLPQLHAGNVWSDVAVALQNAPRLLRRLTYFQYMWNDDDNARVKFLPGMFSSTLAKSIEELHLKCWIGDLTGLAEFSRLRTLHVTNLEDATEVYTLYSTLRLVPSLAELSLQFNWEEYDKPFTPVLPILTDIVNELPGLQHLHVSICTFHLNVSDSAMARFLVDIAQSGVMLHWSMDEHTRCVSFFPEMYRSFLTALLHPRLRHLLDNFYQDDNLSSSHREFSKAVHDMHHAICKAEIQY